MTTPKRPRLQALRPRVPTLQAARVPTLSSLPGATPRVSGRRGVAVRLDFLSRFPFCRHCEARGIESLAAIVDHIEPLALGGPDTEANKQPLCADCDRIKTANDQARIAKARGGLCE